MSSPPLRSAADAATQAAPHPGLAWREFRLIVAFWALFALVSLANHAVAVGAPRAADLLGAAAVAGVESALWAVLTPVVFRLAERGTAARLAAVGAPVAAGMAVVGLALRRGFDQLPMPSGVPESTAVRAALGFGALLSLVLYGGVAAAGIARAYSRRYRARETHAARLEAQLASAQLDALRRQLDPHFLFNTLNLISSLADTDTRAMRRMIARLSELLRFSLEGAAAAEVPLRQELALLDRYLDIVRMRFAGRLEVVTRADDDALDVMVPSLIFQPLVENAIKHGVEKLRGPGRLAIEASCEGETLVLRVRDNGPAWDRGGAAGRASEGVGVRNTLARLEQLYGAAGRFTLAAADDGTVAEVRLPARAPTVLRTRALAEAGVPGDVPGEVARVG